MPEVIAKAFLHNGVQHLVLTGPGRSVKFIAGGAVVTDRNDMPMLMREPGITIEVMPDWADLAPGWMEEAGANLIRANIVLPTVKVPKLRTAPITRAKRKKKTATRKRAIAPKSIEQPVAEQGAYVPEDED